MSLRHPVIRCSVLQCFALCCSVLQCVAVCCRVLSKRISNGVVHMQVVSSAKIGSPSRCGVLCCSVLHCVALCCSVLQCVAVCCSVLQCAAVCWGERLEEGRGRVRLCMYA